MNAKNPSAKVFAAIFAVIVGGAIGAVLLLHTQNAASTNESDTNAVTARAESSTESTNALSSTNSVPVAGATHENGSAGSVRASRVRTHSELEYMVFPSVFIFGMPVAIVVTIFYFQHRQSKMMHDTVRAMIDKGIPVTPELLAGLRGRHSFGEDLSSKPVPGSPFDQAFPPRRKPRNRGLLPGLILTGIGLALVGTHPSRSGTGAWIVLFIGLAFLIVCLVERNDYGRNVTEKKQDNDPQPPKQ